MKNRNKIIAALFIIGLILFIVVQFEIIPYNTKKQEEYDLAQLDAVTHDLDRIVQYKSPYMGDASNAINLFYNLPLSVSKMTFHIISEELTLEINYEDDLVKVGEMNLIKQTDKTEAYRVDAEQSFKSEVYKDLLYNSTAAFALIDNLEKIKYNFSDSTYSVTRDAMGELYNTGLSELLNEDNWKTKVQDKLKDSEYVTTSIKEFFETN